MAVMPEIDQVNANLARLADGRTVRYLNVNDKLADKDGRLFPGMMNERDKLHPTLAGLSGVGRRAQADPHGTARTAGVDRPRASADRRPERGGEEVVTSSFPGHDIECRRPGGGEAVAHPIDVGRRDVDTQENCAVRNRLLNCFSALV